MSIAGSFAPPLTPPKGRGIDLIAKTSIGIRQSPIGIRLPTRYRVVAENAKPIDWSQSQPLATRAFYFLVIDPGVSLRFTPGFMLASAPRIGEFTLAASLIVT